MTTYSVEKPDRAKRIFNPDLVNPVWTWWILESWNLQFRSGGTKTTPNSRGQMKEFTLNMVIQVWLLIIQESLNGFLRLFCLSFFFSFFYINVFFPFFSWSCFSSSLSLLLAKCTQNLNSLEFIDFAVIFTEKLFETAC